MEILNEAESGCYRKNGRRTTRTSSRISLPERTKYLNDVEYNSETTETDSDRSRGPPDTADPLPNYIPHLSDTQNSIKELPTSGNQTTDSPQDSEELPAIESPEAKQPEPSNMDSMTDASETYTPESFDCSTEPNTKRIRRSSKRKKEIDECCPVCGITVRVHELETHYVQEIEKLNTIPKRFRKHSRNYDGVNNTFVQVKSNRENRLTAKIAQYTRTPMKDVQCPICKIRMFGTADEMNAHVDLCAQSDSPVNVDEDDGSSFEEYEIGDETRIRAISLVPGGYRSLQGQSSRTREADIDGDVVVDVDDTVAYGQPQYTELDIISNHAEGSDAACEQLRKAVSDPTVQPRILESRKWSDNTGEEEEIQTSVNRCESKQDESESSTLEKNENSSSDQIIQSLRQKIKDLEEQSKNVKCLICLEMYTKPLISTTCWHVHCEECWLMTMGLKKLCPQCNMIVFPSDLRKIFL